MSADGPPAGGHRISVVLVDDHKMFIQSLAKLLGQSPALSVVALADSGTAALEAVRRHEPDVVLMDNGLPDGPGTGVAEQIRVTHPHTKVVILTADENENVLLAAIEAGCAGYVTKLGTVDEVVSAVLAAHGGEVVMPAAMLARLLPRVMRQPAADLPRVSQRELEVLGLLAQGVSNAEIADRLYLSLNTVRNHVQAILGKLGAHSKLEAVAIAVRKGLIRYP
jgi:DNA-binding NarL/FixJ family response regulator